MALENVQLIKPKYAPFPEQTAFHEDRYKRFARLVSAGTGGGKTACGLAESIYWTFECPGSHGLILYPTYGMLQRILLDETIPDMFGCNLEEIPAVKEFHKTKFMVEWYNGTTWHLLGLDEPERSEGSNVDWIWADEFRLVGGSGKAARAKQETAMKVCLRRLRGSSSGRLLLYPQGIWFTTTPDAPGSVTHENFEDPEKKLEDSQVYRWSIDANIYLPERWRQSVKRAHIPGSGLYNRFIEGLFAAVSAGSYAFDSTIHVFKTHPKLGVLREILYGVDWGWSNPCCILAIGMDGDDRAFILEEFYQSRASLETIIKTAEEMEGRWGRGRFYCGHEEPRSIDEFKKAGLDAVPNKTKRDAGIRAVGGRFVKVGDNRPRIQVHESCVNWISEVQVYDVKKKEYDHSMDATRYPLASYKGTSSGDFLLI